MADTLLAFHPPDGVDYDFPHDGEEVMLAVYLGEGTFKLVNIRTKVFDPGNIKARRIVPAVKRDDRYAPEWVRSYTRGAVCFDMDGQQLPVHHIAVFRYEPGGPKPKKGSTNLVAEKVKIVNEGGRLYLVLE